MTTTAIAPTKPVYGTGEARDADEWWDSLPEDRRCSIHRWIAGGPPPPSIDTDQLSIDDVLGGGQGAAR